MSSLTKLIRQAKSLYSVERAEHSKYFFKTGPGQYGAGDIFWGLSVPEMRVLAKEFSNLSLIEVSSLLAESVHELRLIGLTILVNQYQAAKTDLERQKVYKFYLKHRAAANNWDLVDLSVYKIMGDYLVRHPQERTILYRLVKSKNLWERRLAMVSTMAFIRNQESADVLKLAGLLLNDSEDLLHKASGWMLRELGKRNEKLLCDFLDDNASRMPRTMLRYAIERLAEPKRLKYLKIKREML
ncbi:MAG: DNA alkylation repair protein [Candidatus Falkowbacteria bacterium]